MRDAATHHIDRIDAVLHGRDPSEVQGLVSRSWSRCANSLLVDPASNVSPRLLTTGELSSLREEAERLREIARPELDRLYSIVGPARYVVLLTNTDGVVIEHRGNDSEAAEFRRWGVWLGGVWTEDAEGTNGIGTCVVEGKPLTVHRTEHFRARHISLSCSGAPLFDENGKLIGVMDVSCFDPELSEHAHALTGPLTVSAARSIEERLFRERFRRQWIVAIGGADDLGTPILLAVNNDRQIVGASRGARMMLSSAGRKLEVAGSLWSLFTRDERLFRHQDQGDTSGALMPLAGGDPWPTVVTAPVPLSPWLNSDQEGLYWRPRLDMLSGGRESHPPLSTRGGLPPAALRRVREHIESNLNGNIDLTALAAIAGLSLYHFARAFKQSEGLTPHRFVLTRRLAKARELLGQTDLPLSDIALAVGFADQSHLTRRFRQMIGVSPGRFRKSQR